MRKLVVLAMLLSLMPGCCLVGMTAAHAQAAAHNDEVARRLERGETVPEEDGPVSEGTHTLVGFALGGAIDLALLAIAVHNCCDIGPPQ